MYFELLLKKHHGTLIELHFLCNVYCCHANSIATESGDPLWGYRETRRTLRRTLNLPMTLLVGWKRRNLYKLESSYLIRRQVQSVSSDDGLDDEDLQFREILLSLMTKMNNDSDDIRLQESRSASKWVKERFRRMISWISLRTVGAFQIIKYLK